ncbi:DUF3868 domain-containing protein [Bacteroides helcogenes]|uniref:DUF3868 domain-containing protein n=1 Tax=Bacteroides helcogenes (strain ATCC 35417 / DSM 20613 / JCM 6297 / CCUG 15421 / P 36-108) TaxID=693979 RepID=E6SNF0_BACT6|nr:DUF3868 domain-containing protein [Bacteroides helcogenes]ADV42743.1 hypothetical protein Bache_0720 [Bacteroides helcogenes P 36-108]MDY5239574.1 DUF3868 domain-containing protein [Bacteroides helcogenes]
MKIYQLRLMAATCSLAIGLSAEALAQNSNLKKFEITSSDIYRRGDNLVVSTGIDLTDVKMEAERTMIIYPTIEDGENRKVMPEVIVNGRNKHILYQRNPNKTAYTEVRRKNGTVQSVSYKQEIAYQPWMQNAQMVLYVDICGCGGNPEENTAVSVANMGNLPLNNAADWLPTVAYIVPNAEAVKNRAESGKAFLDFPVNKTNILPDYRNNPRELQSIKETIDKVKNDANVKITHIDIHGYASPEGTYANNERLAKGRAEALKLYVLKQYDFAEDIFSVTSTPEDTEGMRNFIATSTADEKEEALQLMDNGKDADSQEALLRKLNSGKLFRTLVDSCFPALRRSEYEVAYEVKPFSVAEAKEVLKNRPQQLSLQEFYAIAQTYEPGSDEYNETFETAVRMFPDDAAANLNAASTALRKRDLKAAAKYLSRSDANAPETQNNRAVLHYLEGKIQDAKGEFEAAANRGSEAAAKNLKEITISLNNQ